MTASALPTHAGFWGLTPVGVKHELFVHVFKRGDDWWFQTPNGQIQPASVANGGRWVPCAEPRQWTNPVAISSPQPPNGLRSAPVAVTDAAVGMGTEPDADADDKGDIEDTDSKDDAGRSAHLVATLVLLGAVLALCFTAWSAIRILGVTMALLGLTLCWALWRTWPNNFSETETHKKRTNEDRR